jgi:pimeloyl-ACP methyl ester carboxylesterase
MPYAQIGPARIHYVEDGAGPLIVLLHGFPEFWYSWRKQIPALANAGFRVIAPDLRGYNESSRPQDVDAYRMTEIAKDVAGLIVQNGGKCTLVGHDWGGYAAWYTAMLHPGVVERLIILNAPHPKPLARHLARSFEQKLRLSYQLFFNIPVISDAFMAATLPLMMRRAGKFTAEEIAEYKRAWRKPGAVRAMLAYYRALRRSRGELRELQRPITAPTLLIFGDRDPVFMRETTERFDDVVPNIRVEHIADAGHFVQTDAPEIVNQLIAEFAKK